MSRDVAKQAGDSGGGRGSGSLRAGARFGDLTLIERLGGGAQGVVWKARQESMSRDVAVKILPPGMQFDNEQIERFRREGEAAGRLRHPNVVPVHDVKSIDGHELLVQELVEGGNLEDVIEDQRYAGQRTDVQHCTWAARITRQLAEALDHAHQQGVIHRDIKPANVLLTNDGVPKLTDFGLARMQDQLGLSRTGAVMGTPAYMSPEQIDTRRGDVDARSDVYGLGALLYRLLTHKVPFAAKNLRATFADILDRAAPSPRKIQPGVTPDLEAVCLKAIEKSRDDRYQSSSDFAEDLQRYLDGKPTLARPTGLVGRAIKSMRRLATSTLALAAVLVPTAWLAIDRLLLVPAASADVAFHTTRMRVAAVVALLLAWPMGVLLGRLGKGRALVPLAACLIAAGFGVGAGLWIAEEEAVQREEETVQRHAEAWNDLSTLVGSEDMGQSRTAGDLDLYIEAWGPRFGPKDHFVVARGFLKRLRPTRALYHANNFHDLSDSGPASLALLAAVQRVLGDDAAATETQRQVETVLPDCSITDLEDIGDLRRDVGDYSGAIDVYLMLMNSADSFPNHVRLSLAQAYAGLCWNEEARSQVAAYSTGREDAQSLEIQYRLALNENDRVSADSLLGMLLALAPAPSERYRLTELSHRKWAPGERVTLVRQAMQEPEDDEAVLEWCAYTAWELGRESGRSPEEAASLFELAYTAYERLGVRDDDARRVMSLVGMASTSISLSDHGNQTERLAEAVQHASRALELDDDYFEAHYVYGLALRKQALAAVGGSTDADLPLGTLREYTTAYERSLERNGLQWLVLNDVGMNMSRLYRGTGDEQHLEDGLAYVERAVRQLLPPEKTRCKLSAGDSFNLAGVYDTQRVLLENKGNLAAALVAAENAVRHDPGSPWGQHFENQRNRLLQAVKNR